MCACSLCLNEKRLISKIGSVGLRGPGVIGYISLKINSLITLFCRIDILSRSDLNADPQISMAYDM